MNIEDASQPEVADFDEFKDLMAFVAVGAAFLHVQSLDGLSDEFLARAKTSEAIAAACMSLATWLEEYVRYGMSIYQAATQLIESGKWASLNDLLIGEE